MRVLFLDIDGVLNRCDWTEGDPCPALRRAPVRQLNRILKATRAKIMLVSNWRHLLNSGDLTTDGFAFLLRTHGVKYAKVIGGTGEHRTRRQHRGQMVTRWLRRHRNVTSFAVLDDLPEGQEPEWVDERIVRVNGSRGLTARDAKRAIELLRSPLRREKKSRAA